MTVRRGKKIVKYQPNVTNFGFEKEKKKTFKRRNHLSIDRRSTKIQASFSTNMLLSMILTMWPELGEV